MTDYKAATKSLPEEVQKYVLSKADLCKPDKIYVCNGSDKENDELIKELEKSGMIKPLKKYKNCWLALTDPLDVARNESRTVICTKDKRTTVPILKEGVKNQLGNWMDVEEFKKKVNDMYPGCMKGRTMYVIPFSMGPVGSPLSKYGVELTDSAYVVVSMRIMTRIGSAVMKILEKKTPFVKCLHSVGCPLPLKKELINNWPCNPEKLLIAHIPDENEVMSFGSGYGGNSLLGKKCFALRIGSILGKKEGWLAEHMLILGITNPKGEKKYMAAAFPSACGKTNLAMLTPTLKGYKVECVGDDIAWMRFNEKGELRAINPEAGFFGVAPGTSTQTNPNAMKCIQSNTIFTNVAMTSDGGFFWEGLEKDVDLSKVTVTDWCNKPWTKDSGTPSSHPNSRFCTPAKQCPIIDPQWEDPQGVRIEAIIFGGRRPEGVPLVYESLSWNHGVFVGGSVRSEATAAAEFKGKVIMHDPFAMRPFFGYNFGHYMQHWINLGKKYPKAPRIYHVNWFRKSANGSFLWPGFGENCRVLEWIMRRLNDEIKAVSTPIGLLPKPEDLNITGLNIKKEDLTEVLSISKPFWENEIKEIRKYFEEQVADDLPPEIMKEVKDFEERISKFK